MKTKNLVLVARDRKTGQEMRISMTSEAYDFHLKRIKDRLRVSGLETRLALLMAILPERPPVVVDDTEYRYEDAVPDVTDMLDQEFGGEG